MCFLFVKFFCPKIGSCHFFDKFHVWFWTDCSHWDFNSGWIEGEPNFLAGEKCLEHWKDSNNREGWNDRPCNHGQKFVCSKTICSGREKHNIN